MGDLLLHTSVTWINPPASLGKWKKEPQMATFGMTGMIPFIIMSDLSSDASKLLMRTVFSHSFFSVQNGSGLCMQGRIQAEEKNGTFSHKQEANTFTI